VPVTFAEVQQMLAARGRGGQHRPRPSRHDYAPRGLLVCGLCLRRMQGHWANGAPCYRCSFLSEYGLANRVQHPRNVTLRQDAILGPLDLWLFQKFDARHRTQTIDELTAATKLPSAPAADPDSEAPIADCDRKLTSYRAALDAGGDPSDAARPTGPPRPLWSRASCRVAQLRPGCGCNVPGGQGARHGP
jgi:site-specific DNA recombinase